MSDNNIKLQEKVLDGDQVGPISADITLDKITGSIAIQDQLLSGSGEDIVIEVREDIGVTGISELLELKNSFEKTTQEINASIIEAKDNISEAKATLKDILGYVDDIESMKDAVSRDRQAVSTIKSDVESIQNTLNTLASSVAQQKAHVDSEVNKFKNDLSTAQELNKDTKNILDNSRSVLSTIQNEASEIDIKLSTAKDYLDSITNLKTEVDSLAKQVRSDKTDVDSKHSTVTTLAQEIRSIKSSIDSLKTDIDSKHSEVLSSASEVNTDANKVSENLALVNNKASEVSVWHSKTKTYMDSAQKSKDAAAQLKDDTKALNKQAASSRDAANISATKASEAQTAVENDKSDIDSWKAEVSTKHTEVINKAHQVSSDASKVSSDKAEVNTALSEVSDLEDGAKKWADEAKSWAVDNPDNSAKYWANKAKESLDRAYISGGTWNPKTQGGYPSTSNITVDTRWIIVLGEDRDATYSYTDGDLSGITVRTGDELFYDVSESKWNHINLPITSGVSSVITSKGGEERNRVTITAAKLDAFTKTESNNAFLAKKGTAEKAKTATTASKLVTPVTLSLSGDATGQASNLDGSTDVDIPITIKDNSHKHAIDNISGLQGELNKLAPKTGPIFKTKDGSSPVVMNRYSSEDIDYMNMYVNGGSTRFDYKNDEANGKIIWNIENTDTKTPGGSRAGSNELQFTGSNNEASLSINGNKFYHEGFKQPVSWSEVDGKPSTLAYTNQSNTFAAPQRINGSLYVGRMPDGKHNHRFESSDSGATYRTDNPNSWRMYGPNGTFLQANHSNNTLDTQNYSLLEKGERVYSPNNKPSAADVDAVSRQGDSVSGTLKFAGFHQFSGPRADSDLNKRRSTSLGTWGYSIFSGGTPNTFPHKDNANGILSFNTHPGSFWHQLGLSGNGKLYHRYSGYGSISDWGALYSERNKPSAADVGALPANGKAKDASKLGGIAPSKFIRNDVESISDSKLSFRMQGCALDIGGGTHIYNADTYIRMGDKIYAWKINYHGTSSGASGNELQVISTKTGKGYQIDHDGNFELKKGSGWERVATVNSDITGTAKNASKLNGRSDYYHPNNKPSASDVGAKPDNWTPKWADIRFKPTTFDSNWSKISGKPSSYPSSWNNVANKPSTLAYTNKSNTFAGNQSIDGVLSTQELTADRVNLKTAGEWGWRMGSNENYAFIAPVPPDSSPGYLDAGHQLRYVASSGRWQANNHDIFTKEFPPSAEDVNAVPMDSTGDHRVAKLYAAVNKNARIEMTEENERHGATFGYNGDDNYGYITGRDNNTNVEIMTFPRKGEFVDVKTKLLENGKRVYSPNNKPSAEELGVATQESVGALYPPKTFHYAGSKGQWVLLARERAGQVSAVYDSSGTYLVSDAGDFGSNRNSHLYIIQMTARQGAFHTKVTSLSAPGDSSDVQRVYTRKTDEYYEVWIRRPSYDRSFTVHTISGNTSSMRPETLLQASDSAPSGVTEVSTTQIYTSDNKPTTADVGLKPEQTRSIFTGTGSPSNTLGNDGDLYIED